jgi:Zinc-ribbon/CHY zinc finger/Ring finger domain
MAGTFFDRWLLMSGWMSETKPEEKKRAASASPGGDSRKRQKSEDQQQDESVAAAAAVVSSHSSKSKVEITSQAELEKLIRAIASNPALTPEQKNTTIQGLRDSVWKSNQREKEKRMAEDQLTVVNAAIPGGPTFLCQSVNTNTTTSAAVAASISRTRRGTPPSVYYKKINEGKIGLVWSSDMASRLPDDGSVPLFSAAELAPTYHDGAAGAVLGCPHYARACKLRHPKSGRLYTCRLCCEQQRELPMKDQDEPLDRYAVVEVMCQKCNALQPAEDRCINAECESRGKPFAKYFCKICHLYDDGSRPIFHCPYCNTCRLGQGLGVDFRHCMRCNACVSLSDDEHHCIPQKLQGNCPICRESLFQSTEPLRGLKCGHVMHLACFSEYRRGQSYTCPLCMRSMEDMKDYFALLDTAVRMQPMPAAYLSTLSNIYCQDCQRTGQVQYHFVGQKCVDCGSYNTREMGRVHNSPRSSSPQS